MRDYTDHDVNRFVKMRGVAGLRILITSCSGFIGGSVGRFAARLGHEVIGIARQSQPAVEWPAQYINADVACTDLAGVIKEINPDAIFHGAGTASVAASFASPLDDLRASAMTFANVLDGVRRSGVRPLVIFPSSAAVYGNPVNLPVSENAPAAPISPYGYHKLNCEIIAKEYSTCFGLDIAIFRVFSVFGSTQRRLLLWEMFEQLRGPDATVQLQGSGRESRDYLYADDLAAAVLAYAEIRAPGGGRGTHDIFNLASGTETRISDLADEMCRLVAPHKRIEYQHRIMPGYPVRWIADMGKTTKAIPQWMPQPISVRLSECVKRWSQVPF